MKRILILEDNEERIAGFRKVVSTFNPELKLHVWKSAHAMRRECEQFFEEAILISLDHDLNPAPGEISDPGTGLDMAIFLADFIPVCPVIIHSSNTERAYSMQNEFRFAGWYSERVGPIGSDWIEASWLPLAKRLLAQRPNTWKCCLPTDHANRADRMRLSLDGLGLGDAIGEMLAYRPISAEEILQGDLLPAGPWFHTDDTEMAISVAQILKSHGHVDQDALAKRFSRRFERDPERGYGRMTRIQMREMIDGAKWQETSSKAFGGQGSMGNGSAMRVAPLGAYFADDLDLCVQEAEKSSVVTHAHPEGVAGAIAVAVGAALASRAAENGQVTMSSFLSDVLSRTPSGNVHHGIERALHFDRDIPLREAAFILGNGSRVTAPDTVPFCLWVASRHFGNFVKALSECISVGGDCDTNAAIVGGIVALSAGRKSIPKNWLAAREPVEL